MLLKIGELAKRTGLTVRALHHYDDIGLLSPSGRSDAGYRLYNDRDVARLYQLCALRQLGLPLADIGPLLTGKGPALPTLISQQLQALDARIAEATALRERLVGLSDILAQQREPDPAQWLSTLERMTMYDKYFTPAEIHAIEQRKQRPESQQLDRDWTELVAAMRRLMDAGISPTDPAAQTLVERWMALVQRSLGDSVTLLPKLHVMYEQEASVQAQSGIDPAMLRYVVNAAVPYRLNLYARYLNPAEMVRMRAHYGSNADAWPPLIAEIRQLMQAGVGADDPAVKRATQQWFDLSAAFLGHDPQTRQRARQAMENEPGLLNGTGIDLAMLQWLREMHAAATA